MRKTAMMVKACKCMSRRLGGFLVVADLRDCLGEEAAPSCAVEAQSIQRRPQKNQHHGGQLWRDARPCGTRPPSPFSFLLSPPPPLPLPSSSSSSALHSALTTLTAAPFVPGCGTAHASTLAPPAKVRRFTNAATLKTQTRCRSQWGRLHRLRVALDMLP